MKFLLGVWCGTKSGMGIENVYLVSVIFPVWGGMGGGLVREGTLDYEQHEVGG